MWRPTVRPGFGFSTMKQLMPLVRRIGLGVRLGEHREGVTVFGVGDEHLAAVQDVLFAVMHRSRADVLHVAARLRLRQPQPAADFAPGHAREQALFLLRRCRDRR